MNKAFAWSLGAMVLGASVVMLGGCSSSDDITANSVRADMSPEMESIAMTPEQRKNQFARVVDTDFRQIVDDWDRLWLVDKPSGMSRYPIPNH